MEASRKRQAKGQVALERWVAAMPPAARDVWVAEQLGARGGVVAVPSDPPVGGPASPPGTNPTLTTLPRSAAEAAAIEQLERVLLESIPGTSHRIKALLRWYGSGEGSWSTYPPYEDVAETLLLRYAVEDVVAACDPTLSGTEVEGAARYFASWGFWVHRRGEEKKAPPALRTRLLEHAVASGDPDKQQRATRTFVE